MKDKGRELIYTLYSAYSHRGHASCCTWFDYLCNF